MGRRSLGRRLALAVVVVAPLLSIVAAQPSAVQAAPAPITFGRPTVSGVQGLGYEEDLRRDDHDPANPVVYTSVPASLSSGTSWIWRSKDNGQTFKWVPAATPKEGRAVNSCAGGGDTELATDTSGNLYFNDLTLANFSTARSADQGTTFAPVSCTSVTSAPDDRQWYAVDGDPTKPSDPTHPNSLYLAYDVVAGSPICPSSPAQNLLVMARSPIPGSEAAEGGVQFAPFKNVFDPATQGCGEGIMGNDEVDPATHDVYVIHDDAFFHQIRIGRCQPVDFTTDPSGLSCHDSLVKDLGQDLTGGNFPSVTVDKAGNVFAVWEQQAAGNANNDTKLMWSWSPRPTTPATPTETNDGFVWSAPAEVPTPGLHNNVFAWAAAGDDGRVDVAWYGTDAVSDPHNSNGCVGPDAANGHWSLFLSQSLNFTSPTPAFTGPVLASEHPVNNSNIQTVLAGQCGDRALGDFLQLRIGPAGEANISFGDINNRTGQPHAMFVRQNGGSSVFSAAPTVTGVPAAPTNSVADPAGDATYDTGSHSSGNIKNLDILSSSVSRPDAAHYRVKMTVADLSSLTPDPTSTDPDTTLVWQTQWEVPATTNPNGGEKYFAYMESTAGGAPKFFDGIQATNAVGGGLLLTYPGSKQITGSVSAPAGAPGTITIDVPIADVTIDNPISPNLFSVTASTLTYAQPPEDADTGTFLGGSPFDLIDVAPAYDYQPGTDLAVTAASSPPSLAAGNTLTYIDKVTNNGPDVASAATLTDTLPAGVTLLSATASQGSCALTVPVTCALGDINATAGSNVATVILVVSTSGSTPASITNNVTVVSTGAPDSNPGNNSASATTTVNPVNTPPLVDLSMAKNGNPAQLFAGENVTYTLTATNNSGTDSATNVTVNDALPAGASVVSTTPSTGCDVAGATVSCAIGALAAGASTTVTIVARLGVAGTLTDTASVSATEADPTPANNSASATTTVVPSADVAISGTASPSPATVGKDLTFNLAAVNHGPSPASGVTVVETIPAGTDFKSASTSAGSCASDGTKVTCQIGNLATGAGAALSLTVVPKQRGSAVLAATVAAAEHDPAPANNAVTVSVTVDPKRPLGYWLVARDGGIFTFGQAQFFGSTGSMVLNKPVLAMAPTPDGLGYWLVASDGGMFTFGDAQFFGSMGGSPLNKPIVGMAPTPSGRGYWLVASDGGIFAFGDAAFLGSMGATPLNKPIVAMAPTPTGAGYWLVASDGGIFAFGDAGFLGSMGGTPLTKPVVGMAASPTGQGYWMVASDGGIFTFGDASFLGSTGAMTLNKPVVGMAPTPSGAGYWLDASDGGIFTFGDAVFFGSMGGNHLNQPMVGMTSLTG